MERDKSLRQMFHSTGLVLCKFSLCRTEPSVGLPHGLGLAGGFAPLVSFQQRCVRNIMLSPACGAITTSLSRDSFFCSNLLTTSSLVSFCPSI